MERGNGNTVLLTVIGVATLLVALVGATFAYFTANISTDAVNGTVNVTTSTLADLEMTSLKQDNKVNGSVYPGWVGYQAVQVKATGVAGNKAKYSLSLTVTGDAALRGMVNYTACHVDNGSTALAAPVATAAGSATTFKYVAGSLATNTTAVAGKTAYYINGSDVANPSTCTPISNGTLTGNSIELTPGKSLTIPSGEGTQNIYDLYYIIYDFTNETEGANIEQNTAQGQTFNVAPVFTVLSAQ